MKRGQVTLFIILGILIVIILVLVLYFKSGIVKDTFDTQLSKFVTVPKQVEVIDFFVKECVTKTGNDALLLIGSQGGFLSPKLNEFNVGYYVYNGKKVMPERFFLENQISSYVGDMLFFCTKSFIDFPQFDIEQGEIKTKTTINNDNVVIDIVYPLKITKGESTFNLREFNNNEFSIRLGIIYDVSNNIVDEQMMNLTSICLSCLNEFTVNNNVVIDINDYTNYREYIINDENSRINREAYEFRFLTEK